MVYFKDYPHFKPNLTPRQIFKLGSFGGTYWRDIKSTVTHKTYHNAHKKYPKEWFDGIDPIYMVTKWTAYDATLNKYNVRVGTTLEFWESKDWIDSKHPYGWVQWYCDFYIGKRSHDDERQIGRWMALAGPNGRFRRQLINLIVKKKSTYDDGNISPKIRQTLQHWGYRLTRVDLEKATD